MTDSPMQFVVALVAVIAAGFLAYKNKEGWGWMIFVALIACSA